MLLLLLDIYSLLVVVSVVLSWIQVAPGNPIRQLTEATVEPVLRKIRTVVPAAGGFDFSPLVLLLGLHFLRALLASAF